MQELDLRGNAISEVPAAIGNLTALTRCGLPAPGAFAALQAGHRAPGAALLRLLRIQAASFTAHHAAQLLLTAHLTALPLPPLPCRLCLAGNRITQLPETLGKLQVRLRLWFWGLHCCLLPAL